MALEIIPPNKPSSLTREQKAGFFIFVIIAVGTVFLGIRSFGANIRRPFDVQRSSYTGPKFLLDGQKDSELIAQQKNTDTDGDGLNDYDELNVYKTSPYLKDSDSDGYDDHTEILSGNNPNCPSGKECGGNGVVSADSSPQNQPVPEDLLGALPIPGSLDLSSSSTPAYSSQDIQVFLSSLTPPEIRSLLISQGVPKEKVDSIPDAELLNMFQAAMEESKQAGELDQPTTGTSSSSSSSTETQK